MKICHAALPPLVIWYLMYPVANPNGQYLTGAPLSQWERGSAFVTAEACETAKFSLQKVTEAKFKGPNRDVLGLSQNLSQTKCVSGDDPRLTKGVPADFKVHALARNQDE